MNDRTTLYIRNGAGKEDYFLFLPSATSYILIVVRKPSGQFITDTPDKVKIMLTDKELADMADRCNKATSGPWKSYIEGRDHESGSDFIQTPDGDIELIGGTKEDQDFIAHSRTDIPKLMEEIKRLRAK